MDGFTETTETPKIPPAAGNAGKIIAECGVILRPLDAVGSQFHTIECDQTDFIKKCERKLKYDPSYPLNIDQFLSGFIRYLESEEEDDKILVKALQPTRTSSVALDKSRGPVQESVVRLLLQIDDLQTKLISWLLEKLTIISLNDDEPNQNGGSNGMTNIENASVNKTQLILSQLRWLDRIVDGSALTDKFLEILGATSDQASQEVIACLPEVIAEVHNHEKIAVVLRDKLEQINWLDEGGSLTYVILDTLTNLTLSAEAASNIQTSVLKNMDNFSIEERPVLVKFILQTTPANMEVNTVNQLRENLNLEESKIFTALSNTQRGRYRKKRRFESGNSGGNDVALIMDVIRISMTKDRKMADAWFRAVEVAGRTMSNRKDVSQTHKPLDIFILLILHQLPNRKRPIESLMKNKIRNGCFNEDLIIQTFSLHKIALAAHFQTLHQIAECLLHCGSEPALVRFSTVLHREMFNHFDRYSQQEIIGDLVTDISSCGNSSENSVGGSIRTSALSTLKYLADHYSIQMSSYSHFVAHLLEYLDTMNLCQVRQVMDIISLLSYATPDKASTVRNDLHIMVRKQLTTGGSSASSYIKNKIKRMGVIGAVILVKNMSLAAMRDEDERIETSRPSQETSTGSSTEPTQVIKQAIDLLERVNSATRSTGELAGLFMDELSNVVEEEKIAPQLIDWISKKMAEEFENIFVQDYKVEDLEEVEDRPNKNFFVPMSIQYNLENDNERDSESEEPMVNIAIDLTKKEATSSSNIGKWNEQNFKRDKSYFDNMVNRFIPHFRLLRVCIANKNDRNLEDIDALLGCPLWLPSKSVLESFDTLSINERDHVCTILFSTVNWFRELLNAFTTQYDTHQDLNEKEIHKIKVLKRLKGIIKVTTDLKKCLRYNTNFTPPKVLHLADLSSWKPLSTVLSSKARSNSNKGEIKKRKGQKKKLADKTNTQGLTTIDGNLSIMPSEQHKRSETNIINDPEMSISGIEIDHYQPFFRELDLDMFDILKYEKVSTNANEFSEDINSDTAILSPSDLLFLLKDLALKLDHSLVASHTKKVVGFGPKTSLKGIGFSKLDHFGPMKIATKAVHMLTYLLTDLEEIAAHFKTILQETDGIIDFGHGLFDTPKTNVLIKCMERIFTILKSVFAWTGFASKDQRNLLKQGLAKIAERTPNQRWTEHNTVLELVEVTLKVLTKFSEVVIDISTADSLIKLLEAVGQHVNEYFVSSSDMEKGLELIRVTLHDLSKHFLQKEWFNPETGLREKGTQYNNHVEVMLNIYLNNHPIEGLGLDANKNYIGSGVLTKVLKLATDKEPRNKDEENTCSEDYPTLSKTTFLLHFRVLLQHLVQSVKDNVTFGVTKDPIEQLSIWIEAIRQFHGMYFQISSISLFA